MNDLNAPTIAGLKEGELDPSMLGKYIDVTIQRHEEWFQKPLALHIVDEAGKDIIAPQSLPTPKQNRPITHQVELDKFSTDPGKAFQAYYTLDGQRSAAQAFTLKLSFDRPSSIDLSGKNYIVLHLATNAALPPPAGQVPEYAQATRAFPGAAGYESSNPDIALVNDRGAVTALGNSWDEPVTIRALDEGRNLLGSYALEVKGVREFVLLSEPGAVTLESARQTVEAVNAEQPRTFTPFKLPDTLDFEQLNRLYGGPPQGLEGKSLLGANANGQVAYYDLANGNISDNTSAPGSVYAAGVN